jgi:hypothetical protein
MKTAWVIFERVLMPLSILVVVFSLTHVTNTVLQAKNGIVPRL